MLKLLNSTCNIQIQSSFIFIADTVVQKPIFPIFVWKCHGATRAIMMQIELHTTTVYITYEVKYETIVLSLLCCCYSATLCLVSWLFNIWHESIAWHIPHFKRYYILYRLLCYKVILALLASSFIHFVYIILNQNIQKRFDKMWEFR